MSIFLSPLDFRSKAFEGGSDPGRLYMDTVELERWQSDGGEVPVIRHLVCAAALIQFSRLQADRTVLPGASTHTHVPTSVSWICTSRSYAYGNVSFTVSKMHTHAALCYLVLRPFIHTLEVCPPRNQSRHLSSFTRPHVVARCAKHLYSRANHSFVQRWAVTSYIYLSIFFWVTNTFGVYLKMGTFTLTHVQFVFVKKGPFTSLLWATVLLLRYCGQRSSRYFIFPPLIYWQVKNASIYSKCIVYFSLGNERCPFAKD